MTSPPFSPEYAGQLMMWNHGSKPLSEIEALWSRLSDVEKREWINKARRAMHPNAIASDDFGASGRSERLAALQRRARAAKSA